MFHAREARLGQAEDYLRKARNAIEESGNRFLEGWNYKYRAYERLLNCDYKQAADDFESARQAFMYARNPHEVQLCEELSLFARAPLVSESAKHCCSTPAVVVVKPKGELCVLRPKPRTRR